MPWIPQGPYSPGGPFTSANANNIEAQYTQATLSFEQDQYTAFVLSGLVATKDGVTPNKLDVTSGVAFLVQSDSTLYRQAPTASSQTTSTPSATYHLYLQPDGSWYWNTANSPAANSLFIAQVTTDGSGNISTVTDKRTLNTSVFAGAAGNVNLPSGSTIGGSSVPIVGSGNLAALPVEIIVVGPDSSHLPTAGVKGRIGIVVPFSLP